MSKENRISREGKERSLNKWDSVVLYTELGNNFDNPGGFEHLTIVEKCEYCYKFTSYVNVYICYNCPLNKKGVCNQGENFHLKRGFPFFRITKTIFWKYVDEMRKHLDGEVVNRAKAIALSKKIRDSIKNDPAEGD